MKFTKFLLIGAAICLAALSVQAESAVFRSQSFLNVQAVVLTNTWNPTNLASATSVGTNIVGLIFTNDGSRVVVNSTTTTNVAVSRKNPFKDVELWALTDGSGAWSTGNTNGLGILYNQSYATLSLTTTNGSGANTAFTVVVTPLWNGVNEATTAADLWTFGFTPTASSIQTFSTNAPLYKWPGAAKLRVLRMVNTDADADGQVTVTDISLNGFKP